MCVKICSERNLRRQQTKVKSAIKTTYEECKIETREEHVAAVRASEKYSGDLAWGEDGQLHSTSCGDVSMDGAGCTRTYNNRQRGKYVR